MHWHIFVKEPVPLIQAGTCRCRGILRVKRQQHDVVTLRGLQLRNRLSRERMPVAHGHEAMCIHPLIPKRSLQSSGLPLGIGADRRPAADAGVVMLHLAGACRGNQLGQGLAPDAGKWEVNNIGVAEEVIQERFYGFQRVRST